MIDAAPPEQVLKQHGKTFYYAQRFLGKGRGQAVARLYRFCRYIDDLADECPDIEASRLKLSTVQDELDHKQSQQLIVSDFLALARQWQIDLKRGQDLVQGVLLDLQEVQIKDEAELLRYCYYVAGTVGLMMCPLLGADSKGNPFAVDLGVAMQLTNIARDVHYDAVQGRRYLPASWVDNRSVENIKQASVEDRAAVQQAIRQLLDMAETYYVSAELGFVYLPFRSRISIAIAARIYREIGHKLLRNGCAWWQGRIYTTSSEKTRLAAATALTELLRLTRRPTPHEKRLHQYIRDLVNSEHEGD